MPKNSRVHVRREDMTSFNPPTKARARKDIRSTRRPFTDPLPDSGPGSRGLTGVRYE